MNAGSAGQEATLSTLMAVLYGGILPAARKLLRAAGLSDRAATQAAGNLVPQASPMSPGRDCSFAARLRHRSRWAQGHSVFAGANVGCVRLAAAFLAGGRYGSRQVWAATMRARPSGCVRA